MPRSLSAEVRLALDAAVDEVCYQRGVHLASLDEICARAGVGKPSLYRHIGGRDAVVLDYLRRRARQRQATITEAMDAAGTTREDRVLGLVDWVAGWISSDDFRGCGFHRAMLQEPDGLDELVTVTAAMKRWLLDRLVAELPDREALARHLFLLIEGSMAAAMYERDAAAATDLRSLARSLLTGAR